MSNYSNTIKNSTKCINIIGLGRETLGIRLKS